MKLGTVLVRLMAVFALLGTTQSLLANDLEVIHVFLRDEAVGNHVLVEFDISWQNSWRNDLAGSGQAAPYNFDAVWAVVKFSRDGGRTWEHATLSTQASDHAVLQSNGLAAAITTTSDGKGVFLHRGENGVGTINWQDVQLYWDYASDGLAQISSSTLVNVIATEMVYIPEGHFKQVTMPVAELHFSKARLTRIPGRSIARMQYMCRISLRMATTIFQAAIVPYSKKMKPVLNFPCLPNSPRAISLFM